VGGEGLKAAAGGAGAAVDPSPVSWHAFAAAGAVPCPRHIPQKTSSKKQDRDRPMAIAGGECWKGRPTGYPGHCEAFPERLVQEEGRKLERVSDERRKKKCQGPLSSAGCSSQQGGEKLDDLDDSWCCGKPLIPSTPPRLEREDPIKGRGVTLD
jgi:hypothetical protein